MDLQGIISVSGKPGLYKIVSRNRGGIIVESLLDAKKMPVNSASKVSALEDISMYTYQEDVPLKDILAKIYAHTDGKQAIDPKSSNNELFDFFREVLPDFDEDRVYASDVKKLFTWYNLLLEQNMLDAESSEDSETSEKTDDTSSVIEDADAEEITDKENKEA